MIKLPCEVATKSVIPTVRALLALELTETYGMTQGAAASLLGLTQSAISRYAHHERGTLLRIEIKKENELKKLLSKTAASIASANLSTTEVALQICSLCRSIRKRGLMCGICKRADPTTNMEQCKVCFAA